MNLLTVTGNLGKDCEMAVTQTGTTVCSFTLAIKSGFGDRAKTLWIKCALFGKRAEGKLPEYLLKGAQVAVSGELSQDEWEKDGQKHTMLKMMVNSLDLIGGNQQGQQPAPQQQSPQQQAYNQQAPAQQQPPAQQQQAPVQQQPSQRQQAPVQQQAAYEPNVDFDDDIPF